MSDSSTSTYKPMYKVKPYFVIRKVKLPDCMYLIQPIHKLPSLASDQADYQRALDSLEERQERVFGRINELQEAVVQAGKNIGLSAEEIQRLTETHVPQGMPLDVVVTTPPHSPPYSILALFNCIKKVTPTCLKTFVHSSMTGRVDPALLNQFNQCTTDTPSLKITIIWKDIEETTMMFAPGKQIPVSGIANICRFLSRSYYPEIYESLKPSLSSQNDMWLDLLSLSYLHGNAKEKASVLRQLNSALGSKEFLTGSSPALADVVLYCVFGNEKGLKIGSNVKKWMVRCHQLAIVQTVPCGYLAN